MTQGEVLQLLRDALFTGLMLSAPLLLASVIVGLVIAVFQAATQVNEQTMTFVPKIIALALVLVAIGPWMMNTIIDFVNRLMTDVLTYIK
ncbi:MAG: flagellar biosynthesis protein FliQ [Clostridiales bacterium]|nr:flagellar biosynthesis protein FliQ [Clostridiales bacterium]